MSAQAFGGAPPPAQAPCCLLLPAKDAEEAFVSWARARAEQLAGVEVVAPDAATWTEWREGAGGWAGLASWCAAQVRFAAAVLLERPDGMIGRGAGDIAQAFARACKPVFVLRVVNGGPALFPVAGLDRVAARPGAQVDYARTYTVITGQCSASGMLPVFASAPSPSPAGDGAATPPVAEWRVGTSRRRAVHHGEHDAERRRQLDALIEDQLRRDQLQRARERAAELEIENTRLRRLARRTSGAHTPEARAPGAHAPEVPSAQSDAEDTAVRPVRRLHFSPANARNDGGGEKQ